MRILAFVLLALATVIPCEAVVNCFVDPCTVAPAINTCVPKTCNQNYTISCDYFCAGQLTKSLAGLSVSVAPAGVTSTSFQLGGRIDGTISDVFTFVPDDNVGSTTFTGKTWETSFDVNEIRRMSQGGPTFISITTTDSRHVNAKVDIRVGAPTSATTGTNPILFDSIFQSYIVNGVAILRVTGRYTGTGNIIRTASTPAGTFIGPDPKTYYPGTFSGKTFAIDYPMNIIAQAILDGKQIAVLITADQNDFSGSFNPQLVATGLALTTSNDVYNTWPAANCTDAIRSCIANKVDTSSCGITYQVLACPKPTTAAPTISPPTGSQCKVSPCSNAIRDGKCTTGFCIDDYSTGCNFKCSKCILTCATVKCGGGQTCSINEKCEASCTTPPTTKPTVPTCPQVCTACNAKGWSCRKINGCAKCTQDPIVLYATYLVTASYGSKYYGANAIVTAFRNIAKDADIVDDDFAISTTDVKQKTSNTFQARVAFKNTDAELRQGALDAFNAVLTVAYIKARQINPTTGATIASADEIVTEISTMATQTCGDGMEIDAAEACPPAVAGVDAPARIATASSSSSSSTPLVAIIVPIVAGVVLVAAITTMIVIRSRRTNTIKTMNHVQQDTQMVQRV